MNKIVLIGRLTKDPDLRFTPGEGKAVCQITLAVDRKVKNKEGNREADFIPVVIWGKTAEAVATYTAKGKLISVSGRISTRSYEAKDGTKRYVTEVIAEEVQFIEWARSGQNTSDGQADNFDIEMTPVDDGDIPF